MKCLQVKNRTHFESCHLDACLPDTCLLLTAPLSTYTCRLLICLSHCRLTAHGLSACPPTVYFPMPVLPPVFLVSHLLSSCHPSSSL